MTANAEVEQVDNDRGMVSDRTTIRDEAQIEVDMLRARKDDARIASLVRLDDGVVRCASIVEGWRTFLPSSCLDESANEATVSPQTMWNGSVPRITSTRRMSHGMNAPLLLDAKGMKSSSECQPVASVCVQ